MNATRDWNRKGSSCGGVLGQLSHEVLVQHCFSSGLRLNDHHLNLSLTILITLHLFQMTKCSWKASDKRLLVPPPDTTQNNPTSSPELSFSLICYSLCYRISGSFTSSLLARQSRRFFTKKKHHTSYLQDNEKIKSCGVARAFVQISAKWPAVQKVWPPGEERRGNEMSRQDSKKIIHLPSWWHTASLNWWLGVSLH